MSYRPLALLVLVLATGCTSQNPQTAARSPACRYYTGSRLCRDPYEVSAYISCNAMNQSIAQGTVEDPGALSCYGTHQGPDATPNASIGGVTRR